MRKQFNLLSNRVIEEFWSSETAVMMASALVVGMLAGLGTVLFRKAIDTVTTDVFIGSGNLLGGARWYLIVLPALGGLLVGLWLRLVKPQGPGQGVAGIMEAATFHGGRIDLRGSIGRVVGAIITIGTGGSAGPEDPSVQVGATVGSQVGQVLRFSDRRIRTLVGCGAAAGIAAAFNAPISGVFFAVEIILGEFSGIAVSFVVIASVAGAVVSQFFLGSKPAFTVPIYELESPVELLLYFLLGWLAAIVGVLYVLALDRTEKFFERWKIPGWSKPMLGGLAVGVIAFLWRPDFLGTGYSVLESALTSPSRDALFFFALLGFKLIATSLTIGSGGQGGLFAPSLFLGGMLGIGFGIVMGALFPGIVSEPGAYGMVAMGAVLASAVRAPIVAILLPFEMTNDYRIMLPLMLAVVTAYAVARRLEKESIYTLKLRARGVDLTAHRDINIMRTVTVDQAMTRDLPAAQPQLSLTALGEMFRASGHHGFPVVDEDGRFKGVVTIEDYERAVHAGKVEGLVEDIYTREPVVTYPDETLEEALRRLSGKDFGRLPVVDRREPTRLLGVLRRSDILRAYSQTLSHRAELAEKMARLRAGGSPRLHFVEIEIPRGGHADGHPICELRLPQDSVLVSVKRRGQTVIPHGSTVLQAGDRVTAFVEDASQEELTVELVNQEPDRV